MKKLVRIVCVLSGLVLATGCSSMLTSGQHSAKTPWPDFAAAKAAFDRIEPGRTTLADLRRLGFDPYGNANVRILNYLDIQNRFLTNPSLRVEDLPAPVRSSLAARERALAYEVDLCITQSHRYGNVALDMLAFDRQTRETGWSFKALVLLEHDRVTYKLWSGEPNVDRLQRKKQPLGPFQEIEGLARTALH